MAGLAKNQNSNKKALKCKTLAEFHFFSVREAQLRGWCDLDLTRLMAVCYSNKYICKSKISIL
jgi:hypothetical protein